MPQYMFDRVKLLDYSGRRAKEGKPGKIPGELAPILDRLGIDGDRWFDLTNSFEELFRRVAGDAAEVEAQAKSRDLKWFQGIQNCRDIFALGDDD